MWLAVVMGSIPAMCAKLSAVSAILRGTEPVSAIKGALALNPSVLSLKRFDIAALSFSWDSLIFSVSGDLALTAFNS